MPETLGALLREQSGAISGRERELAALGRLLEPGGPVVRDSSITVLMSDTSGWLGSNAKVRPPRAPFLRLPEGVP
jgi:hypothetical protein